MGIKRHEPSGNAWRWLLAASVAYLAANLLWYVGAIVFGVVLSSSSVADALFLLAYGLLFIALWRMNRTRSRPFIQRSDVVAAGGTIRVANGCEVRAGRVVRAHVPTKMLPGLQTVEYLRAFLFGRLGWNRLGGNLIISGAFGLFLRDALISIHGYARDTVGEDMELVARLRKDGLDRGGPSRVEFIPDPVAWTEVPETLTALARQRDRWQRGLTDVMWRHRRAICNPAYGVLGMVVFPFFLISELLGPLFELAGLMILIAGISTGAIGPLNIELFLLVAYGYSVMLQMVALTADELGYSPYRSSRDRGLLILWAVVENLGYRQLTTWWRLRGMTRFLRGRSEWGARTRRGFGTDGAPP